MRMHLKVTVFSVLLCASIAYSTGFVCPPEESIHPCECRDHQFRVFIVCSNVGNFTKVQSTLEHFQLLEAALVWLRIDTSHIPYLSSRVFGDLKLHSVQINSSNLTAVSDDAFAGLESLRFLGLQDNRLTAVPEVALRKLPRLEMLSLVGNSIQALQQPAFRNCNSLKYLSLVENNIYTLEDEIFSDSLRHLLLSTNKLKSLNGTVRYLRNLVWLYVTANKLTSLEGELTNLTSLTHLFATNNHITSIGNTFGNLTSLRVLHLSRNGIQNLDSNPFEHLTHLRELDLSLNEIGSLNEVAFQGLANLVNLDLSHNRISIIQSSFTPIRSLQKLNLSSNAVTTVKSANFQQLNKLTSLDLSKNKISMIDGPHQLQLMNLQYLSLSSNRIMLLHSAFKHLPNVYEIQLDHNALTGLGKELFAFNSNLRLLKIEDNPLQCDHHLVRLLLQLEANLTQIDSKPWCMNAVMQLDMGELVT